MQVRQVMEVGYRVEEASDGQQAIAAYTRFCPDIVLLDAVMPVMDGFSCCKQLQTLPGGDRTPVLMITRLEDEESIELAFDAGATDFITKPINGTVLRQRVRYLLQASQAMAQLRQQTERAQASEKRLRLALEAAHMEMWEWDILSDRIAWSDNLNSSFDLAPRSSDSNNQSFINSVHPEDREMVIQAVRRAVKDGAEYNIEFRVIYPNKQVCWIASGGQVYYDLTGNPVRLAGINADITARKQIQEELQRQNLRSQLFADIALKIRQSLQLDEILQTTVNEIQKFLQADRVLIFRLLSDGSGSVLTEAVFPGWPSTVGQHILDPCFQQYYIQKYQQGRVSTITDITQNNIKPCHVEFLQQFGVKANLVVPIFLKQELWGLLIAHQCASPRQWNSFETELLLQLSNQIGIALAQAEMLEEQTRYSQELARSNTELQQFASIASHDLQEPLRKIQAFGNRLKTVCGDALTEQGRDYLERMQSATQRMQALIDDLLILSRITTRAQPFVTVNLKEVTQDVLSDLEVQIQQTGGQVEVGELPTIDADPVQMRQLLQNLLSNALKFHRNEETPFIKLHSQLLDQEQRAVANSTIATFCQIIVEDNGIGFDEKYLDRIFNVFQRLHSRSEYEGTGMGLAICRKIAERHGGSITAKSMLGKGATFIVTLPVKQRKGDPE